MQQIGSHTRRKSYAHAQPCLPRKAESRQSGTRTVYQQLPPLSQQLKSFRRKLLFQSIPSQTLPSTSNRQSSMQRQTKNEKIHYNSELSGKKYNQTLVTMGSETDTRFNKSIEITKQIIADKDKVNLAIQNQQNIKLNVDNQNNQRNEENMENQENNQNVQNQEDQLQGYTMGNQIGQIQQSEDKQFYKKKSYAASQNHKNLRNGHFFVPQNQSQAFMEFKYLQNKYKLIKDRHEDLQFLRLLNMYKSNKQKILKLSSRKHEAMRTLSMIKKVNSLPKLAYGNANDTKNNQIIIPSFQQLKKNPQQSESRLILNRRLEGSMSFGKLQIMKNSNQNKDINHQQLLQEELNQMMKTEMLLRDKGIKIEVSALKNSLLNIRDTPIQVQGPLLKPRLISNPFEIKQKVKKRR